MRTSAVTIPGVEAPQTDFADVVEPVRLALEQEKRVTEQISELVKLARAEGDLVGEQFLHWFLQEQREEVSSMGALLAVVERSRDNVMLIEDYLARETGGDAGLEAGAPPAAGGALDSSRPASGSRRGPAPRPLPSRPARRSRPSAARPRSASARAPRGRSGAGPASRRLNQSVPNSSRRNVVICAANAQARRYEVT